MMYDQHTHSFVDNVVARTHFSMAISELLAFGYLSKSFTLTDVQICRWDWHLKEDSITLILVLQIDFSQVLGNVFFASISKMLRWAFSSAIKKVR